MTNPHTVARVLVVVSREVANLYWILKDRAQDGHLLFWFLVEWIISYRPGVSLKLWTAIIFWMSFHSSFFPILLTLFLLGCFFKFEKLRRDEGPGFFHFWLYVVGQIPLKWGWIAYVYFAYFTSLMRDQWTPWHFLFKTWRRYIPVYTPWWQFP